MVGAVTATVNADLNKEHSLEFSLQNKLLRIIRQSMMNDIYTSGPVKKVSFIGTRADDGGFAGNPRPASATRATSPDGGGLTNIGIAFLCLGGVVAVSLVTLLLVKRRQRREKNLERDSQYFDATLEPEEVVNDDAYHKRSPAGKNQVNGAEIEGSLAAEDELALREHPSSPTNLTEGGEKRPDVSSTDTGSGDVFAGLSASPSSDAAAGGDVVSGEDKSEWSLPDGMESKDTIPSVDSAASNTSGEPVGTSPRSSPTQVPTIKVESDTTGTPEPPLSPEEVRDYITDTSSLDGANEATILNRLYNISEIDESLMGSTDEEDSVDVLKKAPQYR
jgi:hypothetical protein